MKTNFDSFSSFRMVQDEPVVGGFIDGYKIISVEEVLSNQIDCNDGEDFVADVYRCFEVYTEKYGNEEFEMAENICIMRGVEEEKNDNVIYSQEWEYAEQEQIKELNNVNSIMLNELFRNSLIKDICLLGNKNWQIYFKDGTSTRVLETE